MDTPMIRNYDDPDTKRESILRGSLEKYRNGIIMGRIATPDDHAAAVTFLISDAARQHDPAEPRDRWRTDPRVTGLPPSSDRTASMI